MGHLEDSKARIRAFATFEKGWHFGEGEPFSPTAISIALSVLNDIAKFSDWTETFPGLDGHVYVWGYLGDRAVGVEAWTPSSVETDTEYAECDTLEEAMRIAEEWLRNQTTL